MPTATQPLPPMPSPTHPVQDPRTGLPDRVWYTYLTALDRLVRALREEIP
jgi:hypothetical protein